MPEPSTRTFLIGFPAIRIRIFPHYVDTSSATMNRLMMLKPFIGCPANHRAPIPLGMLSHAKYLPSMLNIGACGMVIAYR